eukprot:1190643-Prorocentrum_minimum.AAC.1
MQALAFVEDAREFMALRSTVITSSATLWALGDSIKRRWHRGLVRGRLPVGAAPRRVSRY